MTIKEATRNRHTVRKYKDLRIPAEVSTQLSARIEDNNKKYGLKMKLVLENTEAFNAAIKLVLAKSVRNYVILAGANAADLEEKLGYSGADVMLFAQTLGLNSWWVGGTFSRKGVLKNADMTDSEKVTGIIAIGYGATQGIPHKSKTPEEVSVYQGKAPEWFRQGVTAALLAPTALNKQAFFIKGDGRSVSISCSNGNFSGTDLGIVKYHFEAGAGTENFEWVEKLSND